MDLSLLSRSEAARVRNFRSMLSSLHNCKPPGLNTMLYSVTKAALRPKSYKFVVKAIEDFIRECKPEWKLFGVRLINSIIRASRRRAEEDLFADRFKINMTSTFISLYQCPTQDKESMIRIINMWQKENIYGPAVIEPLYDLADPRNPIWERIRSSHQSSTSKEASSLETMNNHSPGFPTDVADAPSPDPEYSPLLL